MRILPQALFFVALLMRSSLIAPLASKRQSRKDSSDSHLKFDSLQGNIYPVAARWAAFLLPSPLVMQNMNDAR